MQLRGRRQPTWLDYFQEYGNAIFVALFTLEMLVKMYSLGLQVKYMYYIFLNTIIILLGVNNFSINKNKENIKKELESTSNIINNYRK